MAIIPCPYCEEIFPDLDALAEHIRLEHPDTGRISSRVGGTIEDWSKRWGNRLKAFISGIISWGLELLLDILGRAFAPKLKPIVDMMEATGKVPPELQFILDELKEPSGQVAALFAQSAGGALIGGAIGKLIDSFLLPMAYSANKQTRQVILGQTQLLASWLRGETTPEWLNEYLSWMGLNDFDIEKMKKLTEIRLDPMSWITAFRRKYKDFAKIEADLKHQGWDEERIAALQFITLFYPPPADLIRWQAREVFEPEMIARYGLDSEFEAIDKEPFHKAGMTDEQILNYWRAHWEHASWMQVVEMLHRGLMTEEQVWDWFRVVEIPPFWRQLLIDSAYTWPTRVDVRRWWDMRTIDETELRRLYSGMGYRDVNLDNYVLWTKVYVAFPDLMARWSKGWISLDQVRTELTAMGMPAARLEEFIQMKVAAGQPERTETERDLTKTDIVKGVKTGVITRAEGVELLIDMNYSEDEAVYILEINIPRDQEEVVVKERQLSKADIIKGLKADVITEVEALAKLLELRYSPLDAKFLLDIYRALKDPPVETREREASKADIVLAVKKGLITPEEAYLMLQDIGFTPEASEFILMVKAEVSPFSPVSYTEFKDLTQKYRIAAGMEAKPMPEELKKAAEEVVRLTAEVAALGEAVAEEEKGLIDEEVLPEEATERLKELQVARNRAVAELDRVKSEYDRLVAEWRQQIP